MSLFFQTFLLLTVITCFQMPVATAAVCEPEGVQTVAKCYKSYFANFQLPSSPAYALYAKAKTQFLEVYGVNGLPKFCQWVSTRHACIGPYEKTCVDGVDLAQSLQVSSTDGEFYFSVYDVEKWECGDGFNETKSDFYCTIAVHKNHQSELDKCTSDMLSGFQNKPDSCSPAVDYVNCQMDVFGRHCDAQGRRYACHVSEVAMNAVVPPCGAQLPVCS